MDLGAYSQIPELSEVAKSNGIDIPRLRGYRIMSTERPVTEKELKDLMSDQAITIVKSLCRSNPFWNPYSRVSTYSWMTDKISKYYIDSDPKDKTILRIRWDRIHGWKRKILKFEIKRAKRQIHDQYNTFNKYAGKKDILYIHSRIGGDNWDYYGGNELINQPWFIDRVDDYFDNTYCDIYARIDGKLIDHLKEEYHKSGIVMTEFLRSFNPKLPENICNELLEWSGDDESN